MPRLQGVSQSEHCAAWHGELHLNTSIWKHGLGSMAEEKETSIDSPDE
ncbi:MAG: hypothetical protein JO270_19055 [Acidobacteriaceae bacterium]|nr:hypothetical protein [Acidobacteriaceae bacterium]